MTAAIRDELGERRRAKALAARPSELVEALEAIDWLLMDLMGQLDGQLVVAADEVAEVIRHVDRLVLDQFHAARKREAR